MKIEKLKVREIYLSTVTKLLIKSFTITITRFELHKTEMLTSQVKPICLLGSLQVMKQ